MLERGLRVAFSKRAKLPERLFWFLLGVCELLGGVKGRTEPLRRRVERVSLPDTVFKFILELFD